MKKIILASSIAVMFFLASCEKDNNQTATHVINVTLDANQSYSYTIPPAGDGDNLFKISKQAQHSGISRITTDNSRNTLFEYTPSADYRGSDEVDVTTTEGSRKGGHHGCKSHRDNIQVNYVFKIEVKAAR